MMRGGKSVIEKSKSTVGKCVSEKNSTGGKSGATRTSNKLNRRCPKMAETRRIVLRN
jgi:hypothetical protein